MNRWLGHHRTTAPVTRSRVVPYRPAGAKAVVRTVSSQRSLVMQAQYRGRSPPISGQGTSYPASRGTQSPATAREKRPGALQRNSQAVGSRGRTTREAPPSEQRAACGRVWVLWPVCAGGHLREAANAPNAPDEDDLLPGNAELVLALDGLSGFRRKHRFLPMGFEEGAHRDDAAAALHRLAPRGLRGALDARGEHHPLLPRLFEPPRKRIHSKRPWRQREGRPGHIEPGNDERSH